MAPRDRRSNSPWRQEFIICMFCYFDLIKLRLWPTLKKYSPVYKSNTWLLAKCTIDKQDLYWVCMGLIASTRSLMLSNVVFILGVQKQHCYNALAYRSASDFIKCSR